MTTLAAPTSLTTRYMPQYLSVFRIVVGLLFFLHGLANMFGIFGGARGVAGAHVAAGLWPGWYAALIQVVAGGLVLVGLFTRPAAVLCSGSMAYAYFTTHSPKSLFPIVNGGELAAMFCWSFLTI